jgi:hypothetical protein
LAELLLNIHHEGAVRHFGQRDLPADIHRFSEILDHESKPVFRNGSIVDVAGSTPVARASASSISNI